MTVIYLHHTTIRAKYHTHAVHKENSKEAHSIVFNVYDR